MWQTDRRTNEQWATDMVAQFPPRWKKRLLDRHGRMLLEYDPASLTGENDAGRRANLTLLNITEKLSAVRLPFDATDSDVCERAEQLAADAMALGSVYHDAQALREAMERLAIANMVQPPGVDVLLHGAIARMTCRDWWRRQLRKMHAKAVEGAAIELGYVNRSRDCYVSNESLQRRQQQLKRNRETLENTIAQNELGQEYTLAQLSELSTSNKAIRRGELMTRIVGFERIAKELQHECLFITATCPSRMHKWSTEGKYGVFENSRYDGTTPKEAQAYLSKCWARIRAKLARLGIKLYGFRIVEPHHDGCPHWHILVFFPKEYPGSCQRNSRLRIVAVFRKYLLQDSPSERGAKDHRCEAKTIDLTKGSAAGYISKYISKNIDGYKVGVDLYGNPAMESCMRVEAWAATWGIRQFQQIGGAPVSVWRELRRVSEVPDDAPDHVKQAWAAVSRKDYVRGTQDAKQGDIFIHDPGNDQTVTADWAGYITAQGGATVGRQYLIRLAKDDQEGTGRYGDPRAPVPAGVTAKGVIRCMVGAFMGYKLVEILIKSIRHAWRIVQRAGRRLAPWTCVNNCTRDFDVDYQTGEIFGHDPGLWPGENPVFG